MIDPNMKTLGIKDMHPAQVEALMDFIGTTIELAAELDSWDPHKENAVTWAVEEEADQLVRLFGGEGVKIEIED
jgi:hypothetical protein